MRPPPPRAKPSPGKPCPARAVPHHSDRPGRRASAGPRSIAPISVPQGQRPTFPKYIAPSLWPVSRPCHAPRPSGLHPVAWPFRPGPNRMGKMPKLLSSGSLRSLRSLWPNSLPSGAPSLDATPSPNGALCSGRPNISFSSSPSSASSCPVPAPRSCLSCIPWSKIPIVAGLPTAPRTRPHVSTRSGFLALSAFSVAKSPSLRCPPVGRRSTAQRCVV